MKQKPVAHEIIKLKNARLTYSKGELQGSSQSGLAKAYCILRFMYI